MHAGMVEVGAEALQVVVEVRQVAERERRLAGGAHVHAWRARSTRLEAMSAAGPQNLNSGNGPSLASSSSCSSGGSA